MAKGQVSEEELTKELKGIGNFGGLSAKVQRDNPFRDSRSDKVEQPQDHRCATAFGTPNHEGEGA